LKDIISFKDLAQRAENENKKIHEIFIETESWKTEREVDSLMNSMEEHYNDMKESIKRGINEPHLSISGMSGLDSAKIYARYKNNNNLPLNMLFGKVISYAVAVAEENQRMGRIVACPTAGSCGIVPAVLISYSEELGISQEEVVKSLFTAGGIGKIIAQEVPLAGAIAGCQAECGVSAAMSAGALTELLGGTVSMVINASALVLKNTLGLVCDPVAGLVEVPCIKRNGFYAVHALVASEMALAGVESVIPMDEIVQVMKQIGASMPQSLKESSEGGLAMTPTACRITQNVENIR